MIPETIPNWIDGEQIYASSGETIAKHNPATGEVQCQVTRSVAADTEAAIAAAKDAYPVWSGLTAVARSNFLRTVCQMLRSRADEIAGVVAREGGRSVDACYGETIGAYELGMFMAGEGRRMYGRTTTSAMPGKHASTVRHPIGVAGLIIAANTPIANVAWKVFPALVCGNTAVLKAAEDTPGTAWLFAEIAHEAGLPHGVLNVIQGLGTECGAPLVEHPDVDVISFTGSAAVGREVAAACGARLARCSLELGGKNPLIVCDDADIDKAVHWTMLSAFSNAGQRCASGSRIIVFDSVYDEFRDKLVEASGKLTLGTGADDALGPVINEKQLNSMLESVAAAREAGATVLLGGERLPDNPGYYMQPTLIEGSDPQSEISRTELFGPIACLYRASGFDAAIAMANDSPYGLTACIHTRSVDRAMEFTKRISSGVAVINAGTYGSEPHMPFGGLRGSGNGWREPGTEALDVYSNLKDIYVVVRPDQI